MKLSSLRINIIVIHHKDSREEDLVLESEEVQQVPRLLPMSDVLLSVFFVWLLLN